jgi:hypothetical protein
MGASTSYTQGTSNTWRTQKPSATFLS